MRNPIAALLLLAGVVHAQSAPPSFTADGVVATTGRAPLVPGMVVAIYGGNLGPRVGCIGKPDPHAKETPSSLLPEAGSLNTLIYPRELCGVQVLFGDLPGGLLYVQQGQINFKVPQEAPMEGAVRLRVVYQGQSSASVTLPFGLESLKVSLEAPAHVNGPVWLHLQLPPFPWHGDVNYPVSLQPADFGCQEIEVRREGTPLPRIPVRVTGGARSVGPPCGTLGVPGHVAQHKNRLPLHLQYRFDRPGNYEVRYTRRSGMPAAPPLYQSAWTSIAILPAQPFAPPPAPQDPAEIISDYLPSLLGFADDARLPLVAEFLYDANDIVRRYASSGLAYWPSERVDRLLTDLLHKRGPSDVVVDLVFRTSAAVDFILPDLQSTDPTLLRGAILGVTRLLSADPPGLSTEARARAEDALIAAADNVLRDGVPQTGINYATALGSVHDPRARDLLWSFVRRGLITEQSLICITWFKNPADLPRIANLLVVPNPADTKDRTYASLPYAFYHSYGDAALPVLESVLWKTSYVFVQTNCAEQLVLAGRQSGFAFIAQAIEQKRFYSAEMARFVQDRFPELRGADESKILAFVKSRQ